MVPGKSVELTTWNRASVGLGAILWGMLFCFRWFGLLALSDPALLLLLALLVIAPLALPLLLRTTAYALPSGLYSTIIAAQPFAALIGSASFLLRTGALATLAAGVWLAFTLLLALAGVLWLWCCGFSFGALDDACLAVALIYVPVGGAWLLLARLGLRPIGLSGELVLLTAAHFHYIPLAALTLTGLTGQIVRKQGNRRAWRCYRIIAAGMIVYPPLVAAGITTTQLTGQQSIETVAAMLLAFDVLALSAFMLRFVVPRTTGSLARKLLAISGAAVLLTMPLAAAYALGNLTGAWTITIAQMIALHGWINALLFGCCGLAGWRIQTALPVAAKAK